MQSIHKENKRELIAVNFLGPLSRSSRGVKHILVCIDVFSKAVRLYPIIRPTTKVAPKILLQQYIPTYGKMKKILSDQGVQSVSYTHLDVYKRQLLYLGVKQLKDQNYTRLWRCKVYTKKTRGS